MKSPYLLLIFFSMLNIFNAKAQDWPNLKKYQKANEQLKAVQSGENRVVFMGNSITEGWSQTYPEFFKDKPYINRGIGGQTTPQMLLRFRQDVIDLNPKVVVILAGTNDLAGNTGPSTNKMITDNIMSMAELAKSHGIKVVISSILPVYDYPWKKGVFPAQKIIDINKTLKTYAEEHNHVYLDYHSEMKDHQNGMLKQYTYDGVHATKEGYVKMSALATQAIDQALNQ